MGMFFIYSIKMALCLTVFYLFYKLLLSRDTFHRFNRVTLLSLMCLSALLPLVQISLPAHPAGTGMAEIEGLVMEGIAEDGRAGSTLTATQVLFAIYIIGVVFFLVREALSLRSLSKLMRSGTVAGRDEGARIIVTDKDLAPFSWFGNIVISRNDYNDNPRDILTHEKAHVRHRHSADILFCNLLTIFQWYNPAAWLMRRELKNVHEYEADEAVLQSGTDVSGYQLLLIRKAVGDKFYTMANNLNKSSLKKRITMMMTKKSNPWNRAKLLFAVPVAAFAVAAFATPEAKNMSEEIKTESNRLVESIAPQAPAPAMENETATAAMPETPVAGSAKTAVAAEEPAVAKTTGDDDDVFDVVEEAPEFPGGMKALLAYLSENIKYPENAHKNGIEGRVIVQFVVGKDGAISKAKVVRSVSPELDAEALRVVSAMPKWTPGRQGGKPVNVSYTLPVRFSLKKDKAQTTKTNAQTIKINANTPSLNGVYVVVGGKHVESDKLSEIDKDNIESIVVLKGKDATDKYGDAAKNGAMEITLK